MRISFDGNDYAKKELGLFLTIFNSLSAQEQDLLKVFLASPFFNPDKDVIFLYQRILESYRNQSARINGRPLLNRLYPQATEKKAKTQLRKALRKLQNLTIEFIEHQEIKTNREIGGRVRTLALKKRNETALFHQAAKEFEQKIDHMPIGLMQYQNFWWLNHQLYFHRNIDKDHKNDFKHLIEAAKYQQYIYQLSSLLYCNEILNRREIVGQEKGLEVWIKQYESSIEANSADLLIALYSQLAMVRKAPQNDNLYHKFKASFHKALPELSQPDQLVMIKSNFNLWIKLYALGKKNAPQELFYWAQVGIQLGAFLFEDNLSDREYLNILAAAGIAGQDQFLKPFAEEYKNFIDIKLRDQAYRMALIYVEFFQGKKARTLALLKKYFPKNNQASPIYTYRAKVLYTLVYLILSIQAEKSPNSGPHYFDELAANLEAFRKYLDRDTYLDEKGKLQMRRFVMIADKIYRYLTSLDDQKTKANKEGLMQTLNETSPLSARFMLIEIVESMEAR